MIEQTIALSYDTDQKTITAHLTIGAEPTSISQTYVTAHLAEHANQAKSSWRTQGGGDCTLEAIYGRAADGGSIGAGNLVVLVTAGSSAVPITVRVVDTLGEAQSATGVSGEPITITL